MHLVPHPTRARASPEQRPQTLVRQPCEAPPQDAEIFEGGDVDRGAVKLDALQRLFAGERRLSVRQATAILDRSRDILAREPSLVQVQEPAVVFGDLHGQFYDLEHVWEAAGGLLSQRNFVFNGDYVDRGRFSCEVHIFARHAGGTLIRKDGLSLSLSLSLSRLQVALLLLAVKVNDPRRITLLRGNHESRKQMEKMGTVNEVRRKYNDAVFEKVPCVRHPVRARGANGLLVLRRRAAYRRHVRAARVCHRHLRRPSRLLLPWWYWPALQRPE